MRRTASGGCRLTKLVIICFALACSTLRTSPSKPGEVTEETMSAALAYIRSHEWSTPSVPSGLYEPGTLVVGKTFQFRTRLADCGLNPAQLRYRVDNAALVAERTRFIADAAVGTEVLGFSLEGRFARVKSVRVVPRELKIWSLSTGLIRRSILNSLARFRSNCGKDYRISLSQQPLIILSALVATSMTVELKDSSGTNIELDANDGSLAAAFKVGAHASFVKNADGSLDISDSAVVLGFTGTTPDEALPEELTLPSGTNAAGKSHVGFLGNLQDHFMKHVGGEHFNLDIIARDDFPVRRFWIDAVGDDTWDGLFRKICARYAACMACVVQEDRAVIRFTGALVNSTTTEGVPMVSCREP